MFEHYWYPVRDGDPTARGLFVRHYSADLKHAQPLRPIGRNERFCGPGEHMVLLGADCRALFVWRLQLHRNDRQHGIDCSIFRNESNQLSSELIREADELAWQRWPLHQRHFTFVDATQTTRRRSKRASPGQCFIHAGWRVCGQTMERGLIVLENVR